MNEHVPSIADVLNFVDSFHQQCRNMVRDTVRLLRDTHQIYLTHHKGWDYAAKPNDRFLEQECSSVRQTWSTFLPTGDVQRGALFCFDFFRPNRRVTPALIYGGVYPGSAAFDAVDRWATFYTIADAEKGESSVTVTHDGPIAVVTGTTPERFEEATLVRVPLETITDQPALERIVISPLAALLQGKRSEAIASLAGVTTEMWPSPQAEIIDEEDDDESEDA